MSQQVFDSDLTKNLLKLEKTKNSWKLVKTRLHFGKAVQITLQFDEKIFKCREFDIFFKSFYPKLVGTSRMSIFALKEWPIIFLWRVKYQTWRIFRLVTFFLKIISNLHHLRIDGIVLQKKSGKYFKRHFHSLERGKKFHTTQYEFRSKTRKTSKNPFFNFSLKYSLKLFGMLVDHPTWITNALLLIIR